MCVLPLSDTNTKPTEKMKTQYAVKYELAHTHTGRLHDTMDAAIKDLAGCQKTAGRGVPDEQGISIVIVEGDHVRQMNEEEMDAFADRCQELGIEA